MANHMNRTALTAIALLAAAACDSGHGITDDTTYVVRDSALVELVADCLAQYQPAVPYRLSVQDGGRARGSFISVGIADHIEHGSDAREPARVHSRGTGRTKKRRDLVARGAKAVRLNDMIHTDGNGRPLPEKPAKPAPDATVQETIAYMHALHAYNDAVADVHNKAFDKAFRATLKRK